MIYKFLNFIFVYIFIFLLTLFALFLDSNFIKNVNYSNDKFIIHNFKEFDSFKFDYFEIDKVEFKNFKIETAKSIVLKNLVITTENEEELKKVIIEEEKTNGELKTSPKIFQYINDYISYVNLEKIDNINIENIFVDKVLYVKKITKKKNKIQVILWNDYTIDADLIDNFNYVINLKKEKLSFHTKLYKNFMSAKMFYDNNYIIDGNIIYSDFFELFNTSFNNKHFEMSNILNGLKVINEYNIYNDFIQWDGVSIKVLIPYLKYEDNIFNDVSITWDTNKEMIEFKIDSSFILDNKFKQSYGSFNLKNNNFEIFLDNQHNFRGSYIKNKDNYLITLDKLFYKGIKLKDFNIYFVKGNLYNKFFNLKINNNIYSLKLKEDFEVFVKKNFSDIYNQLQKYLGKLEFSSLDIDAVFYDNEFYAYFNSDNLYFNGKFKNNLEFAFGINNININEDISLKNNEIIGYYDINENFINIDSIDSKLYYKDFIFPIFSRSASILNFQNNEYYLNNINNNFYISFKNNLVDFFSIQPYKLKLNKKGTIILDKINGLVSKNKLDLDIDFGAIDFLVNDEFINKFKEKRKILTDKVLETDSEVFQYDIKLNGFSRNIKKISYTDKKVNLYIKDFDLIINNKDYKGNINILSGDVLFKNKVFNIKESNINILNKKVIVGFNAQFEDKNLKADFNALGNADNNNLILSISSEPNYSELVIINYILFDGELEDDGNDIKTDAMNSGINGFKDFLNLPFDNIKLLQRDNDEYAYQVKKNIAKNLDLKYTKETDSNDIELIYKLNRNFNINSYKNDNSNGVKIEWKIEY